MHGWEPTETVAFEYDGGRLIRATITRESEWNAQEVGYLLASRAIEFEPKNSLGIPLTDAMNPDNQFKWNSPKAPTIDYAAKSLGDAKDRFYNDPRWKTDWKNVSQHGHMWRPPTLKD